MALHKLYFLKQITLNNILDFVGLYQCLLLRKINKNLRNSFEKFLNYKQSLGYLTQSKLNTDLLKENQMSLDIILIILEILTL